MTARSVGVAAIGWLSVLVAGCHTTDAGDAEDTTVSAGAPGATAAGPDAVGVETTLPDRIPPNALLCLSPVIEAGTPLTVQADDPAAPVIAMTEPDDWTAGSGEPLPLTGPDGLSGSVGIAATELAPGASFADYAARLREAHPDLQVQVEGAAFCGYSSQVLTGTFPGEFGTVAFADRITHIWTNTGKYLVTVHLQGPDGSAGVAAAKPVLLQQFTVTIP